MTDPQITTARKDGTDVMRHAIVSLHTTTETHSNEIKFLLWTPSDDVNIGTHNPMTFHADEIVETIHILPIENEGFSVGSSDRRWNLTTGSEIYTDTTQSKTFHLHSGS